MKLSIKDFREKGGTPWYHPLTELKGTLRSTPRSEWLPLGDKFGVGVLSAKEKELVYGCIIPCDFVPNECVRFKVKHGYLPCEFVEKNNESLMNWEIMKKDRCNND